MKFILNHKSKNKITKFSVECLLNNHLDTAFCESYEPLHFVDSVFLCPKFNITNSFITPSSKITIFIIIFGAILQILMHIGRFFHLSYLFKSFTTGVNITVTLFAYESMYVIASILHYGNSIIQSKSSVLLIIKLQQAFRIFDLDRANTLKYHKLWNWINIVTMCITYCVYTGIYIAGNIKYSHIVYSLILIFPQMVFDINIIYLTRTTDLIGRMLILFKNKVVATEEQFINEEYGETHETRFIKSLHSSYTNLIESFCLCKNVFQVSILFHVFQTFALMLITMQVIIELGYFHMGLANISSVAWNLKNLVLLVTMSVTCKKHYEIIKNVEATCSQLAASTHDEDLRRLCKNVVRYNRAAGGKLRACGVLAVDAALPPRVLAAVLAYTVVLLQFAFLLLIFRMNN